MLAQMQSKPRRMMLPMLLAAPLLASGCVTRADPFPPRADVEALTEAKPEPSVEAVTDAKAKARDDAAIEAWGERVRAAGVRVCEWLVGAGGEYDCGEVER